MTWLRMSLRVAPSTLPFSTNWKDMKSCGYALLDVGMMLLKGRVVVAEAGPA